MQEFITVACTHGLLYIGRHCHNVSTMLCHHWYPRDFQATLCKHCVFAGTALHWRGILRATCWKQEKLYLSLRSNRKTLTSNIAGDNPFCQEHSTMSNCLMHVFKHMIDSRGNEKTVPNFAKTLQTCITVSKHWLKITQHIFCMGRPLLICQEFSNTYPNFTAV